MTTTSFFSLVTTTNQKTASVRIGSLDRIQKLVLTDIQTDNSLESPSAVAVDVDHERLFINTRPLTAAGLGNELKIFSFN